MKKPVYLLRLFLIIILVSVTSLLYADPLDETYRETFYITTIGAFNTTPGNENNIYDYKSRLLADNGGIMPKNLKVGYSRSFWSLSQTKGSYYDYIFTQNSPDGLINLIKESDTIFGAHMNGVPWGDSEDQSEDILHNYLEKYNNGEFLQKDQNGRIRDSGKAQEPTADEDRGTFSPYLEMQITLSRNAELVQKYFGRNHKMAARLLRWHQKQHPDLIVFNSMSSESHLNNEANEEYCDYSDASKQEFRDWLSGSGFYNGNAQYPNVAAYNSAFGTSFADWDAVEPPASVNWTAGSEWMKWQDFRKEQVRQCTQYQFDWSVISGMSPDKTFGHQIVDYGDTTRQRKALGDYPSTFALKGANGVTAYGSATANSTIFNTIYNNDNNWGLFEYNPRDTSVSENLNALNAVWNSYGHILCPYLWYGQPNYDIRGKAFETALRQFVAAKASSTYTGLSKYDSAPESKDIIWTMSESDDVEASANLTSITFTSGVMKATASSSAPEISLEIDTGHTIKPEEFYSCAFRIYLTNSAENTGKVLWHDNGGSNYEVEFTTKNGWNVYDINLIESAEWRNKNIDSVKLFLGAASGTEIKVDWFQIKANHCWNFDESGEINGISNIDSPTFSGSNFSGTDNSGDGYFYFSTDDDRNFIDTDFYKKIRVRMNASASGSGQIFWWTRTGGPYFHSFSVQSGWNNYEVDMSAVANWSGDVTSFRFDPVNAIGVSFDIAYLNISPIILTPRIVNSDFIVNSPKPCFLWDKPIEPEYTNVTYSVRLATDTEFTNILFSDSGITSTSTVYNSTELMDGVYWWQVRSETDSVISDWVEPMPIFICAWQFNELEDSDSQNDFDTPTISGGIWSADTTGADPYLYFNNGRDRGVNANVYNRFCCRIKLSASSSVNNSILYFNKVDGWHTESINIPIDSQWHIINKDLSGNPDWNGYINYLRLDPVTASGVTVELDYAYFLSGDTGLKIVDSLLTDGTVDSVYSYTLAATNIIGSLGNWIISSGSLPAGLSLSTDGVISGTPTVKGLSTFTVQINDDIEYTTREFTIDITIDTPSIYLGNPSFAMTNVPGLGYTNIDEWISFDGGSGVNPANGGTPFADNGNIPDRKTVAFVQGTGNLSQDILGFTVNTQYWLQLWYNVREASSNCNISACFPTENDILFVHSNVTAVGSGNDYYFTNVLFTPTVSSGTFSLANLAFASEPDRAALFDAVVIVKRDNYEAVVKNPSFETSGQNYYQNNWGYIIGGIAEGVIAGWTIYGSASAGMGWQGSVFAGNTIIPDGKTALFIQSTGTGGARQDIEVISGNNYNLSYCYNMRPGNSATISVSAGGSVVHTESISYAGDNQPFYSTNFTFHADSNTETIQFEIQASGDSSLLIDDVSLRQVIPEPALFWIFNFGFLIYLSQRKN